MDVHGEDTKIDADASYAGYQVMLDVNMAVPRISNYIIKIQSPVICRLQTPTHARFVTRTSPDHSKLYPIFSLSSSITLAYLSLSVL